jgi:hypothetical protein
VTTTIAPLSADHTLVDRFREALRGLRWVPSDVTPVCATTDPEVFHPTRPSPASRSAFKDERRAMSLCAGCLMAPLCLVRDLREAPDVEDVRGVRAGIREADRRALYLTAREEGLL